MLGDVTVIGPTVGQLDVLLNLCPSQIAFHFFLPSPNKLTLESRLGFGVRRMQPPAHQSEMLRELNVESNSGFEPWTCCVTSSKCPALSVPQFSLFSAEPGSGCPGRCRARTGMEAVPVSPLATSPHLLLPNCRPAQLSCDDQPANLFTELADPFRELSPSFPELGY